MAFTGESALSAFFEVLDRKILSLRLEFVTEKRVRKEIMSLERMLRTIHPVLADAEEKQMKSHAVKIWLADLQQLAYDVDDMLDVFATRALEQDVIQARRGELQKSIHKRVLAPIAAAFMTSRMMMIRKIKQINCRFKGIQHEMDVFGFEKLPNLEHYTMSRLTHSFVNVTDICGRENDKNAIVDMVLSNDDGSRVSVIPIVGMGGIGKTALAQLVYNDERVEYNFNLKVWVCVSPEFDIIRITKAILQSIGYDDSYYPAPDDLNMLQIKLTEKVAKQKFILVLDDVWNKDYADWSILLDPLEVGAPGSKILVTTRSSAVATMIGTVRAYQLERLSDEECMSLFTQHAIGAIDFKRHPHLKEIGEKIVKKCGGLPLAAKAMGGLLRCRNPNEWLLISERDMLDFSEETNVVLPALRLSYFDLPSHLKRCFAYCSLFPKDYEFTEEEMVLLWMAQGYVGVAERETDTLGGQYFYEFLSRSLFQISSRDKSRFVIPQLINDLAQSVAEEYCFRMEGSRRPRKSECVRHLSYVDGSSDEFKNFKRLEQLRTFLPFLLPNYSHRHLPSHFLLDLLPKLKSMRVLSFKGFSISKLPDSFGGMRLVRYLDFSLTEIKKLPDSICTLYGLQTLILRQCWRLESLPYQIGNLVKLGHLDLTEAFSLREMPIQIGQLTHLQTLSSFVVASGNGHHITLLKNLSNLKGELSIWGLENVVKTQDAMEARLSEKSGLDRLNLRWRQNYDPSFRNGVAKEVLDALQPPTELRELRIEGYDGTLLSNWLGDPSFSSLMSLELKNCINCTSMPSIGNLPKLKHLCIKGMSRLRSLGVELFGGHLSNASSSLETLLFEDMPEWEGWNFDEQAVNFTCLLELSIICCPKLGRLPTKLPSLEKLVILRCNQLAVSIASLPRLNKLEINECKSLFHESSVELSSLKKVSF